MYRRKEPGKLFPKLVTNFQKRAVQRMRIPEWLKIGLVVLGAVLLLACNPLGDGDDEAKVDDNEIVEVGNQINSENRNQGNQFTEQPGQGSDNQLAQASPTNA